MKKGIFTKLIGRSSRHFLYRAVCILIALTALSSWAVSGVYAKYVDAASADGSAGVARMGVVKFELKEHKAEDISDDLDKALGTDMLYELDEDSEVLSNTYSTVIPGTDIPKDPFINLELANNEVSYELYVKVEKKNLSEDVDDDYLKHITWAVTDSWEEVKDADGKAIEGLYRYKVPFMAGTPCKFTSDNGNPIQILKGNKIKVSQYFNSEPVDESGKVQKISFSVTFTAYLQQIINIPQSTPEEGSGDTDSGN